MPGTLEHGKVTIERVDPRLLTGEPWYFFNIYNTEWNRNTGTTGAYFIPACPVGKEYVRGPQHVEGMVTDTYPHFGEHEEYRTRIVPGQDIVKAVLEGSGPGDDIRRFGIFASHSVRPSKDELAEAKRRLIPELQRIVREADEWSVSADSVLRSSIAQKHYDAANYLNLKRGWMSVAEATGTCVFCGSAKKEDVPICPACNQTTDPALLESIRARLGKVN